MPCQPLPPPPPLASSSRVANQVFCSPTQFENRAGAASHHSGGGEADGGRGGRWDDQFAIQDIISFSLLLLGLGLRSAECGGFWLASALTAVVMGTLIKVVLKTSEAFY